MRRFVTTKNIMLLVLAVAMLAGWFLETAYAQGEFVEIIDYQSYVAQYQARGAQNVSSGAEVVVYGKDFVLTDMAGELI